MRGKPALSAVASNEGRLRHPGRRVAPFDVRQQDGEFAAADAGHRVAFPDGLGQFVAGFRQQAVTHFVAEGVVEAPKPI